MQEGSDGVQWERCGAVGGVGCSGRDAVQVRPSPCDAAPIVPEEMIAMEFITCKVTYPRCDELLLC